MTLRILTEHGFPELAGFARKMQWHAERLLSVLVKEITRRLLNNELTEEQAAKVLDVLRSWHGWKA